MDDYPIDDRGLADDRRMEGCLNLRPGRLRKLRHFGDAPDHVKIGASVRTSFAAGDVWIQRKARRGAPAA